MLNRSLFEAMNARTKADAEWLKHCQRLVDHSKDEDPPVSGTPYVLFRVVAGDRIPCFDTDVEVLNVELRLRSGQTTGVKIDNMNFATCRLFDNAKLQHSDFDWVGSTREGVPVKGSDNLGDFATIDYTVTLEHKVQTPHVKDAS